MRQCLSLKFENYCHALALYVLLVHWVCMRKTLRMSAAMAAGLTDKLMEMSDLVAMIDAAELAQLSAKRQAMLEAAE
jgi:hypothetical protein